MKQKQETKITTLCRLVAVYNDMLFGRGYSDTEYKIRISIAYRVGVSLYMGEGVREPIYTGTPEGAISAVAVRLCDICNLPRVAVDVVF